VAQGVAQASPLGVRCSALNVECSVLWLLLISTPFSGMVWTGRTNEFKPIPAIRMKLYKPQNLGSLNY
jgi:hypothetical protein